MNKPITVIREDVRQQIATTINSSGLPAFVVEPILQEFLIETRNAMKIQYEKDKKQYDAFIEKENNKKQIEEQ